MDMVFFEASMLCSQFSSPKSDSALANDSEASPGVDALCPVHEVLCPVLPAAGLVDADLLFRETLRLVHELLCLLRQLDGPVVLAFLEGLLCLLLEFLCFPVVLVFLKKVLRAGRSGDYSHQDQ